MHVFLSLGLLAASVAASALTPRAEKLQPCGNAFYVPSQYTCYPGNQLCPVLNGVPTKPCGKDCYSEIQYSCKNGKLSPPTPNDNSIFRLLVQFGTSKAPGSSIEANGLVFRVGGQPASYCPSNVGQCPPGKETIFIYKSGYTSLNVEVPGGQQAYVAPNGAVSFTQAHSGIAPPGSYFDGFAVNNKAFTFQREDFLSCPPADGSSDYQLFARSLTRGYKGCVDIKLVIDSSNAPEYGAWQYT